MNPLPTSDPTVSDEPTISDDSTVSDNLSAAEPPTNKGIERLLWGVVVAAILFLVGVGALRNHPAEAPQEPLLVIAEVPHFQLINRDGQAIALDHFLGRPWVADFIFTRCVAVCPRMSYQMKRVSDALGPSTEVQIASISVDPEHDTPAVLTEYAQRYDAGDNWYFLTGDRETIHNLTMKGFLLALDTDPDPSISNGVDPIIHSNRFVLVDREGQIRGYYDPFQEGEVERLLVDLGRLQEEQHG